MAGGGNTHSAFILDFDFTQEEDNHFGGEQKYRIPDQKYTPGSVVKYRYDGFI